MDRSRWWRWSSWNWETAGAVAISLCAAFSLGQMLLYGYGVDHGIYATVADEMLHGGAPYIDVWDFKPPGIYFVFLLSRVFGRGEIAIRIVEVLAWLLLIQGCVRLGRCHFGGASAGLWGGCLGAVVVSQIEFWDTAQPEIFASVALVWALLLVSSGSPGSPSLSPRRQLAAWMGAGACFAAAGMLKFPQGGGIVISWVLLCRRTMGGAGPGWKARLGAALRPTLALGAGAVAVIGACLVYLAVYRALGAMWDVFLVYVPGYTDISHWSVAGVLRGVWPTLANVLADRTPLLLGGVLLLVAIRDETRWGEPAAHALGILFVAILAVPLQWKFLQYHYTPALVLCALFAGMGYRNLFASLRRRGGLALLALVVLGLLYRAHPTSTWVPFPYFDRVRARLATLTMPAAQRQQILDVLSSNMEVQTPAVRAAARWIAEHTPQGSRLYVWGFKPVLYYYSRRRPASRFIYNAPQRGAWSAHRYRPLLLDDLAKHPPAAIVVDKNDRIRVLNGDDKSSAEALVEFPELRQLLSREYSLQEQTALFDIYLRAMPVGSPGT